VTSTTYTKKVNLAIMNSRPIPIIGCLEEGKDEDAEQSGVG
jgi:hypothetical protein